MSVSVFERDSEANERDITSHVRLRKWPWCVRPDPRWGIVDLQKDLGSLAREP
jgi:hypothetical protein